MRLAIFDVDGTVLRGNSWQAFFWWAVGEWPGAAPGLLARLAARRLGLMTGEGLRAAAVLGLRGRTRAEVEEIGRRIFRERLASQVRSAARAEVERVKREGFVPVLATGAFDFLAERVAEELGVADVVCTRLEYEGEVCAGRIRGVETRREAKAAAVRARFAGGAVDWAGSRAYSDDVEDAPLWALVGAKVLVCPDARKRTAAEGVTVVVWPDA
jgi:HAD-superfamily subfamily IB hydrolase, TIGR01490